MDNRSIRSQNNVNGSDYQDLRLIFDQVHRIRTMTIKCIETAVGRRQFIMDAFRNQIFPVPDSPISRTGNFARAAFLAVEMTVFHHGETAII